MLAVVYLKYNYNGGLHNKQTVPQYVNRPVCQALGGMHSRQTLENYRTAGSCVSEESVRIWRLGKHRVW